MPRQLHIRAFSRLSWWLLAGATFVLSLVGASAQSGDPIKIGYGISQTGGLAPNGKSALLAQRLWEDDVNAKGGLLGRPVKLVYYDDQTNPATVPALYQKLLDVDKVDIVIGGYGTNLRARRGAQSRGMVTGRAGSHPLRRFRQKTDCESAHGEHVDWESA